MSRAVQSNVDTWSNPLRRRIEEMQRRKKARAAAKQAAAAKKLNVTKQPAPPKAGLSGKQKVKDRAEYLKGLALALDAARRNAGEPNEDSGAAKETGRLRAALRSIEHSYARAVAYVRAIKRSSR